MAVDSAGNVYVADAGNHTIRKVTAAGVVTTAAGTANRYGSADGTGAAARFYYPAGVAVDSIGNVYVADRNNHTIRKVTPAGVVTTLAGTAGRYGSADGTGAAARFYCPVGVAVDNAGNVYVTDQSNNTIRKVTATGGVTTLAGTANLPGSVDGPGPAARFYTPAGVAVDSAGNVYIADEGNHTIRKVTAAGDVTTLAGTAGMADSVDGTGAAARFKNPRGIAVDSVGYVYVADIFHTIRRVTAAGGVTTLAGRTNILGSTDGTGSAARFNGPASVAVDMVGNVYVADQYNHIIRKVTAAGGVTTLAGTADVYGSVDSAGAAARFSFPWGVAVDGAGNVYVAEWGNSTIRKVTAVGVVTTLVGIAGISGSADGTGSAAHFLSPWGVVVDSAGSVYVADTFNHTIRKVTAAGNVTTLAGTAGASGSADGQGSLARFYNPVGVTVDGAGNVYVADQNNHIIRKITDAGVVTTLAGTAAVHGSADGTGSAARFYNPAGIAVDGAGNVYVADSTYSTIRKVTPGGVVTTLAGTAGTSGSADGTGAAASFCSPSSVAVDSAGNVYVVDHGNSTLRKVTPTGTTTTVAGAAGVAGILLGSIPRFASPLGLAIFGDSIVLSDANAILLLRHGAQ